MWPQVDIMWTMVDLRLTWPHPDILWWLTLCDLICKFRTSCFLQRYFVYIIYSIRVQIKHVTLKHIWLLCVLAQYCHHGNYAALFPTQWHFICFGNFIEKTYCFVTFIVSNDTTTHLVLCAPSFCCNDSGNTLRHTLDVAVCQLLHPGIVMPNINQSCNQILLVCADNLAHLIFKVIPQAFYWVHIRTIPGPIKHSVAKFSEMFHNLPGPVARRPILHEDAVVVREPLTKLRN